MKISFTLILLFFLCISLSYAQSDQQIDTASNAYRAKKFFNAKISHQSRLFNGSPFEEYYYNVVGSANFQDLTTFSVGWLVYDGVRFDSIPMMYNLHQEKLLLPLTEFTKYSLVNEKVSDFHFNDHHFQYIHILDTTKTSVRSGFFDVLYNGQLKILAKRTKGIYQKIENQTKLFFLFSSKTSYYLKRDEKWDVITSQSSLLNYFKDKKPALESYIKANKIKYKKDPERAMSLIAQHYETLIR